MKFFSERMRDASSEKNNEHLTTLFSVLFTVSQDHLAHLDSQNKNMRFHNKAAMMAV